MISPESQAPKVKKVFLIFCEKGLDKSPGLRYTIVTKGEGKPHKPERGNTMMFIRTLNDTTAALAALLNGCDDWDLIGTVAALQAEMLRGNRRAARKARRLLKTL